MTDSSISTRVASELLSVHESSIKRWCNAGELDYWTTPGGHRRIPIKRLVAFAEERGIESEIGHFAGSAERVWIGLEEARRRNKFDILSKLVLEWINLNRVDLVEHLVVFLLHRDIALTSIFDEVVADAMGRIGSAYIAQKLSVGDEHRLTSLVRDVLLGIRNVVTANGQAVVDEDRKTAIVGCIRGEIHEIGAIMVRLVLLDAGWNVIYLGQDVPTEEFHAQALKHDAALICISMNPPRGETDAADAIKLLANLFDGESSIRVALGGSTLKDAPPFEHLGALEEVKYFNEASSFRGWVRETET